MSREQDDRPRKKQARKMTPDGLEERSENIGDTSREGFNLRTERDAPLGRNRAEPRDAPVSVHETIARHRDQARQFAEHAAAPEDARDVDIQHSGALPPSQDTVHTGVPAAAEQPLSFADGSHQRHRVAEQRRDTAPESGSNHNEGSGHPARDGGGERLTHESSYRQRFEEEQPGRLKTDNARLSETPSQNATGSDFSDGRTVSDKPKRGSAYQQKRFDEFRADKPDTPRNTEYPVSEPLRETEHAEQTHDQPQTQPEPMPDDADPVKPAPLSHEHTQRSLSDRPGRLIHDRVPGAPKDAPRKKPSSPDAAKCIPPETDKTGGDTAEPIGTDDAAGVPASAAEDVSPAAEPSAEAATAPTPARDSGAERGAERSGQKKPGKLQFTENETAPAADAAPGKKSGRKLEKTQYKAGRSGQKLDKARDSLPKKRSIKIQRAFDEKSQKPKRKLVFEEEVKSQRAHMKGPVITRPVKAGVRNAGRFAHSKVYQVEHENVGVKAAHRAEMLAEGGLRTAYRLHKTAPYRKVAKLEAKTTKLNMKASYQKALHDNPKLKSNILSRMAQKKKIQRQYAKAARDAKKAGQRAKKTGDVLTRAGQAIVRFVARHPLLFGIIGGILLLIIIFSSLFTSCSNIGGGVGGVITAASYLAQDADVDDAELYYTEWETDLLLQIGAAESSHPGYDEYRYQVGNVGHNPYELMAFLTAVYQEFTYAEVEPILRQIFAEQYTLTFTPSVETRYTTPSEPDEGAEAYDWNVLTVTLTSRSFTEVVLPRMNMEQRQHFDLLMRTKGSRQYAGSPFDFNWLPYVSSYYGYRVHPISGAKDYHLGVDIAVPVGTDILAAHDGTVSVGWDAGGYGHYITLTGTDGLVTRYGHLDSVTVSNGQTVSAGDVISKSGNSGSSTGPHLHYEVMKDGRYINPLYFSLTNDDGSSLPAYGYAGSPMGDGSYAALIEEAERHLGKSYQWGAFGPNTFDCSGFVSYVLIHSGVKDTGRLTAQGLYNICTPVSPADAMPGDLIFFTGTYSAPHPVTHVGIYVGGGQFIHAGNPISYASANTSYWQSKFYAFGRIN